MIDYEFRSHHSNDEIDSLQMVSFLLGREKYALDIMEVKEVLTLFDKTIHKLPYTPDYVEGIFEMRGEIIPLISLHEKFDLEKVELSEEDRLLSGALIVKVKGFSLAIRIDKILRVIYIKKAKILPVPEIVMTGMARENIKGIFREEDHSYLILMDLMSLFSESDLTSFSNIVGANSNR